MIGMPMQPGPTILAGPTCDSTDILYHRHPYELPCNLAMLSISYRRVLTPPAWPL